MGGQEVCEGTLFGRKQEWAKGEAILCHLHKSCHQAAEHCASGLTLESCVGKSGSEDIKRSLENISLLTKIKRRKGNGLFPLDVFEMLGNAGTSLGPQSRLWRMKPTQLREEEQRAGWQEPGFLMTSTGPWSSQPTSRPTWDFTLWDKTLKQQQLSAVQNVLIDKSPKVKDKDMANL